MVISIDIGTSYSSVCRINSDGKAVAVDVSTGVCMYGSKYSLPTAVFWDAEQGCLLLGQTAMNSRISDPKNFRMEFKRNFGEDTPVLLGEREFRLEELYTELYRYMKKCAEKVEGVPVELAYLTHPASYGEKLKRRLLAAARAAGLFHVHLVDEPTAAAMSFLAEHRVRDGQTLLVYDFGGGTFDVSLLQCRDGTFHKVTEPDGLNRCGGIDMDRLIYQDMIRIVPADVLETLHHNPMHMMRVESQIGELAVKAKHHLSSATAFQEYIVVGFDTFPYELTRERFNKMVAPLVADSIQVCRRILQEASLQVGDLDAVLLVGGASRTPLVKDMLGQFVGESVPVLMASDMELAVAQGALSAYETGEFPEELETAYDRARRLEEEQNFIEAAEQYRFAAQEDNEDAIRRLAEMYCLGQGVPKDMAQAAHWERAIAEKGDAAAQYRLGLRYCYGLGVPADDEEAAKWYLLAAQQGMAEAENEMGACYRRGRGVEKNLKQASDWYALAWKHNLSAAEYSFKDCVVEMSDLSGCPERILP